MPRRPSLHSNSNACPPSCRAPPCMHTHTWSFSGESERSLERAVYCGARLGIMDFQEKRKERLGIMRMDYYRSRPGDSTPKLKQPSGPRQIVRGSRVVNLGRAADQVFVKARRSRCGNFPRYVACNPRHIIWWCLLETTTIRIYTRPARRTSLIARLASSIS